MDPAIRAMQQDVRIAGPAVTVHQPGVDGTIIGYALGQLRPGDVLVVDRCGDMRHAGFGGVVAYAAKAAKIAGVIIDGVVADIGEIRRYGVPVWCRGLSPITTKRIGLGGTFCAPVSCGGVSVRPGDVIIADECGSRRARPRRRRGGRGSRDLDAGRRSEDARAAGCGREAAGYLRRDEGSGGGDGEAARLAQQAQHRARHQR